jgi:2-hydroxycyclohexanecarboxyl-CoA dehydrogenase
VSRHEGKIALITGAGQGIGRGIALALAKDGATVVAVGRTKSKLEDTCAQIAEAGGRAIPVVCDIAEAAQPPQCIEEVRHQFGRLDILVNNAQVNPAGKLLDISEEDWYDAFESGPFGAFRLMRLAHPLLKESKGVIINIGSGAQFIHDAHRYTFAAYVAAKFVMNSLTRTAAVEWGHEGIRALLVCPAAWTEMSEAAAQRRPEAFADIEKTFPVGRMGYPEADIGRPVSWLCSEEAGYITGSTIMLDGGQMFLR